MARPVDARGRAMLDGGSNHGNMLRAKAQQIYSASSGGQYTGPTREGRPIGPTQGHSGLQQGAKDSVNKMDFRNAMNSRGELRESAVFRKRTDNLKNVDIRANNVMREDRQRIRPDRGYGMSIEDKARDRGNFEGRTVSSAKIGSEVFNQIKKNFNTEQSEIKENIGFKKGDDISGEEAVRSSVFHDAREEGCTDKRGALGNGDRNAIGSHTGFRNDSTISKDIANSRQTSQIGNKTREVDSKDSGRGYRNINSSEIGNNTRREEASRDPRIGNRNDISSEKTVNSWRNSQIGNNKEEAPGEPGIGSRNSSFNSSNTNRVRVQVRQSDITHSRNSSKSSSEDFDNRNNNLDISPRNSSSDVGRTLNSSRSSNFVVNRTQKSSGSASVDFPRAQIEETNNPANNCSDSLKKDFGESKIVGRDVNKDLRESSEGQDFKQPKIVSRDTNRDLNDSSEGLKSTRKIVISNISRGSEGSAPSDSGVARFVRDNIKNLNQDLSSGKINVSSGRNERYGKVNYSRVSNSDENTPTSPAVSHHTGLLNSSSSAPTSLPVTHNKGLSGHSAPSSPPNKHIGIVRSKSDEPLPNTPAATGKNIKITVTSESTQEAQSGFKQPGRPVSSMDKPERKYQVQEKIVKIRKQSIDLLHTRQSSDPTQLMTRKLSNVSQDLMRYL